MASRMSKYLYNADTNSIVVVPSSFNEWTEVYPGKRLVRRVKDMACWCRQSRSMGTTVTYDDWGDGPQCNLCGELKEE